MHNRLVILYGGEENMIVYVVTTSDSHKYASRLSKELSRIIIYEEQIGLEEWEEVCIYHNGQSSVEIK